MTMTSNAENTFSAIGQREDLSDIIYRVAREETPFISMIGKSKATGVKHEWQTEALATPDTTNAQLEGDEITSYDAANNTSRLYNTCQISRKTAAVTGTAEAVNFAGRSGEMDRQMVIKGLELKRDMESILVGNQASVDGTTTTARKLRSLEAWYATNDSRAAGGADGSTSAAATDSTTSRAVSAVLIKSVAQKCWEAGGKPTVLMVSAFQKGAISGLNLADATTGIGITKYQDTSDSMAVFGIDVIVTDFGKLRVVPSIHVRSRTAHFVQPDMWALSTLRNMKIKELAPTGDSNKKMIISEYTLEARNEASSGVLADLTTS
jgi:hypothetical protein